MSKRTEELYGLLKSSNGGALVRETASLPAASNMSTRQTELAQLLNKKANSTYNTGIYSGEDFTKWYDKTSDLISRAGNYYNKTSKFLYDADELQDIYNQAAKLSDYLGEADGTVTERTPATYTGEQKKFLKKNGYRNLKQLKKAIENKQGKGKYDKEYGSEYVSQLQEAKKGTEQAIEYLDEHANEYGNAAELRAQLSEYSDYIDDLSSAMGQVKDYFNQWENEDEYKNGYKLGKTVKTMAKATANSLAGRYTAASAQLSGSTPTELTKGQSVQQALSGQTLEDYTNDVIIDRLKRANAKSQKADEYYEKASGFENMAKWGKNGFEKLLVSAGIQLPEILADSAVTLGASALTGIPGAGLVNMGIRAFGDASHSAREAGLSWDQAELAGWKSAGIEIATEKMFSAVGKLAYGSGYADNMVEKLIDSLDTNKAAKFFLKAAASFGEEGLEEVLSDVFNPAFDYVFNLRDKDGKLLDEWDSAQVVEDFLVGGIMGLAGMGGQITTDTAKTIIRGMKTNKELAQIFIEEGQTAAEDSAARLLADKYSGKKKLSAYQKGKLGNAVDEAHTEQLDAATETEAMRLLQEHDDKYYGGTITADDDTYVSALVKKANGEELSKNESEAFDTLTDGREMAKRLAEFQNEQRIQTMRGRIERLEATEEASAEEVSEEEPEADNAPAEFAEDSQFAGTWDQDNIVESMFPEEVKSGILNAAEAASIQSMYDNSGRTMDLNEVETMVREYIATKENNNGRNDMDGSLGRNSGEGAEGEGRAVREGAGRDKAAEGSRELRADSRGEGVRREAGGSTEGKVSSRELGIKDGTDEKNVSVIPENKWSAAEKRIAKAFGPASNGFVIVSNNLGVAGGKVNGAKTQGGRIIVSRSSRLYKTEQLMIHEGGHLYLDDDASLREKLRQAAANVITAKELKELAAQYALKWKGLYNDEKNYDRAANGEMTADEQEAFEAKYVTEVLCDALAGIDRADTKGTSRFSQKVREEFLFETGIDIDALLNGSESAAETETKETESKAKPRETRNNGPPKESYSYAGERAETADRLSLDNAKQMLDDGVDSETVRQQTGWFKGMDGKWRFEIDDSEAEISLTGSLSRNPDIRRYNELLNKAYLYDDATKEELDELRSLDDALKGVPLTPRYIGDMLKHIALYEAYPEIADIEVVFVKESGIATAGINPTGDRIFLNNAVRTDKAKLKKTLLHELQHAIQIIEGHAGGASVNYWKGKMDAVPDEIEWTIKRMDEIEARVSADLDIMYDNGEITDDEYEQEYYSRLERNSTFQALKKRAFELRNEKMEYAGKTPDELYKNTAGEIEARDTANRSELTAEERKNTRPDIDRADVVFTDSNESYSIDENLEYELHNVYNDTFDSSKNEVHIGTASNFITEVIGAEAFDNYMPAEKAYRAMVTEEKAIFDGKPTGKNINYHGLGVDGLKRILVASENPIAAFAASPDESGKRENRIVLVTDEAAQGGLGIVIQEVDAYALKDGKRVKSNKSITVYPKTDIANAISDAIADGRILFIDKKRSQTLRSGVKGSNYPTAISEADFTINIRRFWENVKWKKSGKAEMSFESGIEAEPEWKKRLREYDSYSTEDEPVTQEEAERRKNFKSTVNKESLTKLRERQSRLEGLIAGYERTENRTERMERELGQAQSDLDAVKKAIEKKQQKAEQEKQNRRDARAEASAAVDGLSVRQTTAKSRKAAKNQIYDTFGIESGHAEIGSTIDAFLDRWIEQGSIRNSEVNALEDMLMEQGVFRIESANDYAQEISARMRNGQISVPAYVVEEFGDDWNAFQQRAFANRIYLSIDSNHAGIDQWTTDLAASFGAGTFDDSIDLKTQLENIVDLAEEGRAENLSVFQIAERMAKTQGRDSADAYLDEMHEKLMQTLKSFAQSAKIEMETVKGNVYRTVRENAERKAKAERAAAERAQREFQQKTLKQLQWLKRNQNFMGTDFQEEAKRILADIDTIAVSAANEMNWSDKYNATWEDLAKMYDYAKEHDPNFMPSKDLENIVARIRGTHLDELSATDLENIYKAAVAIRTAYYNRNNIIGDELHRTFAEAYDSAVDDMRKGVMLDKTTGKVRGFVDSQLNPIHRIERMFGWKEDSAGFQIFGRGLEKGERQTKRYVEQANQILDEWMEANKEWVAKADGQGKDAIWYELEVPELLELKMGDKPIFGETVKVYMTPMQKIHMYLESKNYDNLRHMVGGRTFVDKELYSKGEMKEAFAKGTTISLAPETVKKIVSDLTPTEMELANILDRQYYNGYAKTEINRVSNILYGYDRAMSDNYAPIRTDDSYNKSEPGVYQDGTAEGVGHMKTRVQGAKNPTYNVSALEAFRKHVSDTSRFVGMAIPMQNAKTLLNWQGRGTTMQKEIKRNWSQKEFDSLEGVMQELQAPTYLEQSEFRTFLGNFMSNYIGGTFASNITVAAKVLASEPTAAIVLGGKYYPSIKQKLAVDTNLISKYTSELDVRIRGYGTPELAAMTLSTSKYMQWVQSHKATKLFLGGGLLQAADIYVTKTMWPWAENKVREEFPELEVGTQEQIDNGTSPFYKKVAEVYENAIGDTQSMYDIMHRSDIMRDSNEITRSFTIFHTDSLQLMNLIRKRAGELDAAKEQEYNAKSDAEKTAAKAKVNTAAKKFATCVGYGILMNVMVTMFDVLRDLFRKRKDKYEDEEGNLTFWSFVNHATGQLVTNEAGLFIGMEFLVDPLIAQLTGEQYYAHELIEIDTINDIRDLTEKTSKELFGFFEGLSDVMNNDGDVWKYIREDADFRGIVKKAAGKFLHYFKGLPVENVERLITNTIGWIFPQVEAAYDGLWSNGSKKALAESNALDADIKGLYNGRADISDETASELARLYETGYKNAIMSDTPTSLSYDGEEYKLSAAQQQTYDETVKANLTMLNEVIGSDEYQSADDDGKEDMLRRLYDFAKDKAKMAVIEGYEGETFTNSVTDWRAQGMSWGRIMSGNTTDVNKFAKYIDAGMSEFYAGEVFDAISILEPEFGVNSVSSEQKVMTIAYLPIPETEKEAAMKVAFGNSDKAYNIYMIARKHDVGSADYADFIKILASIDTNGGYPKQSEFIEAINRSNIDGDTARDLWYNGYGWKKTSPWG